MAWQGKNESGPGDSNNWEGWYQFKVPGQSFNERTGSEIPEGRREGIESVLEMSGGFSKSVKQNDSSSNVQERYADLHRSGMEDNNGLCRSSFEQSGNGVFIQ